jgi:hypothetical protein
MTGLTNDTNISKLAETFNDKLSANDVANTDERLHDFLVEFANEAVTTYTGTFPFMLNMQNYVKFGLSDAQVAGVINCVLADYRHNQKRAAVAQAQAIVSAPAKQYDNSKQYVADGWYTIVGPQGGHRTLRLQTVESTEQFKNDGVKQWLSYLAGADNVGDYKTVGFVHGNEVTLLRKYEGRYNDIMAAARFLVRNAANIGEYGRQYALRSGKCYVCNRKLTTPESIAAGIGPVCASK